MKRSSLFFGLALALLPAVAPAATGIDANIFFDGTNRISVLWNATPGKVYVLQSATNLAGPWRAAAGLPATWTATTNWLGTNWLVEPTARFFKVVKLDTDGPEVFKTAPFDGAIGVSRQTAIQAWLRDETGVNTNSIVLTVGTNAPVSLGNPHLSYAFGLLTYTPATNEFLGTNGQMVSVTLSAADTLGNQTTNFAWAFELELAPVVSPNIIFLGAGGGGSCHLTLLSTNGDTFTFAYTGSCCLTTGTLLANADPYTGYTRAVVSFTNYPASNVVVALTRPAKLAEAIQTGTLTSGSLLQLTNAASGPHRVKDNQLVSDFPLQFTVPLGKVLNQDANGFLVETTSGSQLVLGATLHLAGNLHDFKLTAFQAQLTGTANFELDLHAKAAGAKQFADSVPLFTPPPARYLAFVGAWPVWVDVKLEVDVGYAANFQAAAEATTGVNALKTISVGRKWDAMNGWQPIFDNPPVELNFVAPTWQVQGSADVRAYLQPKVSVLVYSAAGVSADLEPYLELQGNVQLNPYQWDLTLFAGLDSTLGLDLKVWDDSLDKLPSVTFNLIPEQTLWHDAGPGGSVTPPQITAQPQGQTASTGATVSFFVQAQGSAPLRYRWYKNGLYLTDDTRVTGSTSSTLRLANVQTSDAGNYTVRVSNPAGSRDSASAVLTVVVPIAPAPSGMALIPAGAFQMGYNLDGESDAPVHSVYVSAFYMDKYDVTFALWQQVYNWAITHGYNFDYAGSGKAANHPVQMIDWYDSAKWCNARSEMEGKTPAYYTSAALAVVYRTGGLDINNSCVNWNAGYRLATEAEWEKAARGGLSGQRFPWGNTISESQANYYSTGTSYYTYDLSNTGFNTTFATGGYPYTSPVGYFASNGYGLYDMAGNVWQWCWDWYGTYGSGSDPRGPISGSFRVFRGGCWFFDAFGCRAADRVIDDPSYGDYDLGFRSVLPSGAGSPTAPTIASQPQSQSVLQGATAMFSVQATGSEPLSYRWMRDGLALNDDSRITGSASSSLQISNVQSTDAGNYSVQVSNQAGSADSANATLTVSAGAPQGMVAIPAGSFAMGDTFNEGYPDEIPVHQLYVSAFFMDQFEVTKTLWDSVYSWAIAHGYSFDNLGAGKAATHPVQTVDWYDVVKWCNARSEKEGLTPCYYSSASQTAVYRSGQLDVQNDWVNWTANGYRLPTEAEWEKAARGGLSGKRYPWGDTITHSQANYNNWSGFNWPNTTPVGSFAPNGYGLYDMAGNVDEWCWDWDDGSWYGSAGATQNDSHGPAASPLGYRIRRDGSWGSGEKDLRCANRNYVNTVLPSYSGIDLGFRCVRGF